MPTEPAIDPSTLLRLDDRVAVVTGASSGLGERMARTLHAAGAHLVVAARRVERLDALAADLPGTVAVGCDVSNDAELDALVATTMERFGRIDVLVNNAGVGDPGPAETESAEAFRNVIGINLTATFLLAQKVGVHMLAAGSGTIVNVASVLGLVGSGQIPFASYASSKGGVVQLTRELSAQWARRGVRVNALAPGWFASEMTAEMFADEGSMRWVRRKTPMGRAGEPHELDGALLFLAGDASTYVTGQVLAVDGGWTAV